jgi:hypothetical protein
MDALRARAYLDLLLGTDSRPVSEDPGTGPGQRGGPTVGDGGASGDGSGDHPQRRGGAGSGRVEPGTPAPGGPLSGVIPPGFAGRINLTIPATTMLGLADRPGELAGLGPIDPDLARELAAAAARNPRSTWCMTVTDSQGHAIGHGCARPAPAGPAERHKLGTSGGPDPPGPPQFTVTPTDNPGPPTSQNPPGIPYRGAVRTAEPTAGRGRCRG